MEKNKLTYSLLGQAFEKQIKATENQGIKQVEALKALKSEENIQDIKSIEGIFPKDMRTNETKNKTDETEKSEEKVKRKDLKYKTNKHTYDFQQYESIRSFDDSIYTPKTNIVETEEN